MRSISPENYVTLSAYPTMVMNLILISITCIFKMPLMIIVFPPLNAIKLGVGWEIIDLGFNLSAIYEYFYQLMKLKLIVCPPSRFILLYMSPMTRCISTARLTVLLVVDNKLLAFLVIAITWHVMLTWTSISSGNTRFLIFPMFCFGID